MRRSRSRGAKASHVIRAVTALRTHSFSRVTSNWMSNSRSKRGCSGCAFAGAGAVYFLKSTVLGLRGSPPPIFASVSAARITPQDVNVPVRLRRLLGNQLAGLGRRMHPAGDLPVPLEKRPVFGVPPPASAERATAAAHWHSSSSGRPDRLVAGWRYKKSRSASQAGAE